MKKPLATWRGLNCEWEPWALASSLVPASATLNQPHELSGSQSPSARGGRLDSRCVQSPDQPWGLHRRCSHEAGSWVHARHPWLQCGQCCLPRTPRAAPSPQCLRAGQCVADCLHSSLLSPADSEAGLDPDVPAAPACLRRPRRQSELTRRCDPS